MLKKIYAVELALVETTADVDEHDVPTQATRKNVLVHYAGPDDEAGAHALFHKLVDVFEAEGKARRERAALASAPGRMLYCGKCRQVTATHTAAGPIGSAGRRVLRCVTCHSVLDWVPSRREVS